MSSSIFSKPKPQTSRRSDDSGHGLSTPWIARSAGPWQSLSLLGCVDLDGDGYGDGSTDIDECGECGISLPPNWLRHRLRFSDEPIILISELSDVQNRGEDQIQSWHIFQNSADRWLSRRDGPAVILVISSCRSDLPGERDKNCPVRSMSSPPSLCDCVVWWACSWVVEVVVVVSSLHYFA